MYRVNIIQINMKEVLGYAVKDLTLIEFIRLKIIKK